MVVVVSFVLVIATFASVARPALADSARRQRALRRLAEQPVAVELVEPAVGLAAALSFVSAAVAEVDFAALPDNVEAACPAYQARRRPSSSEPFAAEIVDCSSCSLESDPVPAPAPAFVVQLSYAVA